MLSSWAIITASKTVLIPTLSLDKKAQLRWSDNGDSPLRFAAQE
jgi:hypothetical protein